VSLPPKLSDQWSLISSQFDAASHVPENNRNRSITGWAVQSVLMEKGSIRYYGKSGWDKLIRVDYHGAKEVPTGTCHAILKNAGIKHP